MKENLITRELIRSSISNLDEFDLIEFGFKLFDESLVQLYESISLSKVGVFDVLEKGFRELVP